jgi:hypothetical protein
MRRTAIAAIVVAVAAVPAAAEPRRPILDAHGGISFTGPAEDDPANHPLEVRPVLGASLAWDRDPPSYPGTPGTRAFRGDLVPELSLHGIGHDAYLLGGVRFELEVAEYKVGLLGTSSRTQIWLAPKLGVTSRERTSTPVIGGDLGAQFVLRSGWRVGYWLGVYAWREEVLPCACLADVEFDGDEGLYADDERSVIQAHIGLTIASPL